MIGRVLLVPNILIAPLGWAKQTITLALLALPLIAQATPADFGSFVIDNQNLSRGRANGAYTTPTGATGEFTVTREDKEGYRNKVTFRAGSNGIEILNQSKTGEGNDEDKFVYIFTITPTDKDSIHTIKIGQASYTTSGNSNIALQRLEYDGFDNEEQVDSPVQATIRSNSAVSYFYGAMGDYFMGREIKDSPFTLSSENPTSAPQLRKDDTNDYELSYYDIVTLKGIGTKSSFVPTLNDDDEVTFKNKDWSPLDQDATFANILKPSATPNSFSALSTGMIINDGDEYVSYGIANVDSNYVIAVENAKSVTIEYEGIMTNYSDVEDGVIGETEDEWISFGVESRLVNPVDYSFSGIVFNDNGNITASDSSKQDTSTLFTSNSNYFNGVYDNDETSIYNNGLQIRLTDCNGSNIATNTPNPQTVSSALTTLGQYNFIVQSSALVDKSKVCLIQSEPNSWEYIVDTTPNRREVLLVANTYDYKTKKNTAGSVTRNLDFGEVKINNTALVLIKSQYVHACNNSLDYSSIPSGNQPTTGFSINAANDVEPGNCIAYKINAYNRGHVDLKDIKIMDSLQSAPVESVFHLPQPLSNPSAVFKSTNSSVTMGDNGSIISDKFDLAKVSPSATQPNIATLYFNTQYGAL